MGTPSLFVPVNLYSMRSISSSAAAVPVSVTVNISPAYTGVQPDTCVGRFDTAAMVGGALLQSLTGTRTERAPMDVVLVEFAEASTARSARAASGAILKGTLYVTTSFGGMVTA